MENGDLNVTQLVVLTLFAVCMAIAYYVFSTSASLNKIWSVQEIFVGFFTCCSLFVAQQLVGSWLWAALIVLVLTYCLEKIVRMKKSN